MNRQSLLEVHSLTKRFQGLVAVSDVSVEVAEGQVFGIIGPNGAGKTTLFNCVTGLLPLNAGSIRFGGIEVAGWPPHKMCKAGMGRTFQIARPFGGLTVNQTVTVGALNRTNDMSKARSLAGQVLEQVGLAYKGEALGKDLTVIERKRLELARALATQPRLLLLDEVVAGLNASEVTVMVDLIRSINMAGVTVLMIEHVMQAVTSLCDTIAVLNYGEKIAEGAPLEVMRSPSVIEAYLGEGFKSA